LDPKEGETVYDPACGTGGMLIEVIEHVKRAGGNPQLLWGKLFGQEKTKESVVTEEEISSIVKQGLQDGAIDTFEHKVLQKVLQFGDKEARVMMTPIVKVIYLDLEDGLEENQNKILLNPHRHYPVCEGSLENFKGIIDAKDVLTQQMKGNSFELESLIKKAPFISEGSCGSDIVSQFTKHKTHVVVVVDEYGYIHGILTLMDIFESLLGSMPETSQSRHYDVMQREDGSWLVDGLTPIDEIEDLLSLKISDIEGRFNTVAGFCIMHFQTIPKAGDYFAWEKYKFEIMDMDGVRIDKVLIQKIQD
jgi:putative hemolysin